MQLMMASPGRELNMDNGSTLTKSTTVSYVQRHSLIHTSGKQLWSPMWRFWASFDRLKEVYSRRSKSPSPISSFNYLQKQRYSSFLTYHGLWRLYTVSQRDGSSKRRLNFHHWSHPLEIKARSIIKSTYSLSNVAA